MKKLKSLCFEFLEVDGQYRLAKGIDPQSQTIKDYVKKIQPISKK